jgi:hypothetical protein
MLRKFLFINLIALTVAASFAASAGPRAQAVPSVVQQVREAVNTRNVAPCQGKKEGDKVTLTSRSGGSVQATCTLTAIKDPTPANGTMSR